MARGIQEQDVWQAADALLLEGARPTIERVRQRIGSGSPNTVSPHLETWFKHLGRRIKDPGAFAVPPEVPDPVMQAARHFWETALAQTRSDFDERLQEGLALALDNVQAEREKAARADATASEAMMRAATLQGEFADQGVLLKQAQQNLAAERARLEEVRTALNAANDRLADQKEKWLAEMAEVKQQLAASIDRADAADRRVALELERERMTRAKAERHVESLQKTLDAAREKISAANEQARQKLDEARNREELTHAKLAATTAELALERQNLEELRAARDAGLADASAAHARAEGLQGTLDRFAALVESRARMRPLAVRKRSTKSILGK